MSQLQRDIKYEANPFYASAGRMRLYRVTSLQLLCLQKYKTPQGLALKLDKNAEAAAKRAATIAAKPPGERRRPGRPSGYGSYYGSYYDF